MLIFYIVIQFLVLMIEKSLYNNIIGDTEHLVIATDTSNLITILLASIFLILIHLFRKRKLIREEKDSNFIINILFTRVVLVILVLIPFMYLSQESFMTWFNDWIINTEGKTLFDLLPLKYLGSINEALSTISFDFFISFIAS